jgi:Ca2+-transporting ATPase
VDPRSGDSGAPAWWALAPGEIARLLEVDPAVGLRVAEAGRRLKRDGPNRLAEAPERSAVRLFLGQFTSTLVALLAGAAVLSVAVGQPKDAAFIVVVLSLNAVVGFWQEYRAERSLAELKRMLPAASRVRRDGAPCVVPAASLAIGDVVLLEAGDRIPADGRLIAAHGAGADESALTGESRVSDKDASAALPIESVLGDRITMAFMNTLLVRGRAELLVTATGMGTEMGHISAEIARAPEAPTPLQRQLDRFGKRMGAIVLALTAVLSVAQLARGEGAAHIVFDAIALAVAGVPEGLPVVVTVTLALGMQRLARQRAVVKRLPSVETLGSTTVICSDKTGTLTLNEMTARAFFCRGRRFRVTGEGYGGDGTIEPEDAGPAAELEALMAALAACGDCEIRGGVLIGDPTEGALAALAAKGGMTRAAISARLPRVGEIPFDPAYKFMATFHASDDGVVVYVKGAPDVLLARCTGLLTADSERPCGEGDRADIDAEYRRLASRGLRGLLVATRSLPAMPAAGADLHVLVRDLTFLGLVGVMDPPRPEARAAIAECAAAGIAVKMITGDHPDTATAIARELGLHGGVVNGAELDRMDVEALAAVIDRTAVFARVTPQHKVKIVRALKERGHVVAMTGDGVNDAPAMKHADIGIAMGIAGTSVSKEAASMILTDDDFATIVRAVREGRVLYDNILKFVRFQLSTTIGAILVVFFAPFLGLPEPFTPTQILWVALIMDGPPAVSLALDAARPKLMREPPRPPDEPILPWFRLARILAFGTTMAVGTLGVLFHALAEGHDAVRASSLAFTTFVLFQFFNVFNARVEHGTAFNDRFFANAPLWISLAAVVVLQVVAVEWPAAQPVFRTASLSIGDWLLATAVASSVLLLEEARKLAVRATGRVARAR